MTQKYFWTQLSLFAILCATLTACGDSSKKNAGGVPEQIPHQKGESGFCGSLKMPKSGAKLSFCTKTFSTSVRPPNVIYFFHGLGGSAKDIYKILVPGNPFYELLLRLNPQQPPAVISLSVGARETLPIEPTGDMPPSLDDFIHFAMGKIETQMKLSYSPQSQPARHLVGISMGGHTALTVSALSGNIFTSTIALCPAVIDFNPFDDKAIENYINRAGMVVDRSRVADMISMLRSKFSNVEEWNQRDSIQLAAKGGFQGPLYMSTGLKDEYGFHVGLMKFEEVMWPWRNEHLIIRHASGKHCSFRTVELASFVSEHFKTGL